jgi:hypothetical protein
MVAQRSAAAAASASKQARKPSITSHQSSSSFFCCVISYSLNFLNFWLRIIDGDFKNNPQYLLKNKLNR